MEGVIQWAYKPNDRPPTVDRERASTADVQGTWGGSSGGDHHLYDGEDDNDKDDNENSKNQEKQTKEDEDDESMMHGRR